MEEASRLSLTEEIKAVAEEEGIPPEKVARRLGRGEVVIVRNVVREVKPLGIGKGLRTKINANIGTSSEVCDVELELRKAFIAIRYGADTIMDLSTGGDLDTIRRRILKSVNVPVGTVPIYQAGIEAARKKGAIIDMDEDDMFNAIEKHAKDGVDFVTVHVGVTKENVKKLVESKRIIPMVSRGGTFHAAWILHHDKENPLYENFDYLLEIARQYDMTLSLGDGLRPGCIHDATDVLQISELVTISRLVERAREKGVQVIVEGPGHVPINEIAANIRLQKSMCKNAPFYVLGPLVTDIAPGYDHIVGAIGGAIAALEGADFLCYVTPAEHLRLPGEEDVKLGVIAAKIAAHVADIAKLGQRAAKWDDEMAKARVSLDWGKQFSLAIDPEKARAYHEQGTTRKTACTMCGEYCAMKLISEALGRKDFSRLTC
ncbi:MAG: phosphomethylpyrimidine synthase ThiC [Nitrososphaerota archaeon]